MRATSPPPHPSLPYWPFIDGKNQLRINTAAINQFNRSLYKMAYYQRSADRQLCGCWHRNCVDSGKENRMRGVEGPSLDFHIFRALQEARCFHFISGVPPNWRTARCCRPRNISFVRRKWKLKIESYIQHTHTHTHSRLRSTPGTLPNNALQSLYPLFSQYFIYNILYRIYEMHFIYLNYLT